MTNTIVVNNSLRLFIISKIISSQYRYFIEACDSSINTQIQDKHSKFIFIQKDIRTYVINPMHLNSHKHFTLEQPIRRESALMALQYKRTIFKAIDPQLKNQDYLFKTKKLHQRHRSQPLWEDLQKMNKTQRQPLVQSFPQTMRKMKMKVSHQRVASEVSDSCQFFKKSKHQAFQYNKWYIKPENRMKRRLEKVVNSPPKRFLQTQFCESTYENLFRQSKYDEKHTDDPFSKTQNHNITFAKQFVRNDKNQIRLLKQFKRKQTHNRNRTPHLVDLILQLSLMKKHQKRQDNKKCSTKISSCYNESENDSKNVSNFQIQDMQNFRLNKRKKPTTFRRSKKRLTLLETEFTEIKSDLKNHIGNDQTYEGFRIERIKIR